MNFRNVIIPAAGFGTRMGMPSDKSKELLLDDDGQPLIQWHIDRAENAGARVIVLTRPEKTDLITYLRERRIEPVILSEPYPADWPHTVLASQPYWGVWNVLALPDTRYAPTNTVSRMFAKMEDDRFYLAAARHWVENPELWGIVEGRMFIEKPQTMPPGVYNAWGLLGWHYTEGEALFRSMCTRNNAYRVEFPVGTLKLSHFEDLTRDPNRLRKENPNG